MTHSKRSTRRNTARRLFSSLLLLSVSAGIAQAQAPCNKPVFNLIPGTITAYTAPNNCNPLVSFLARVVDSSGLNFNFNLTGATSANGIGTGTGRNFNLGTTYVDVTATNGCGSTTASFAIKVKDTLKPVLSGLQNITVDNDANSCGAVVPFPTPNLTDPCPGCSYEGVESLGFVRMGEFQGHTYFRTPTPGSWDQVDSMAHSVGGYLVNVNSSAEDAFINLLTPDTMLAWIGYTDRDQEGVWKWTNGDTTSYTNWCALQPDNWLGGQNYALIHSNGAHGCWDDGHSPMVPGMNISNNFYGIVEMPACNLKSQLTRIAGLDSGSFFPIGTTIVTYQGTDESGNVTTASFNVTVRDTMRPVFNALKDITVFADPNKCGAQVTYATPAAADLCPTCNLDTLVQAGFVKIGVFDGHSYFRTPTAGTWNQSDSVAHSVGGYLISINTFAEDSFMAATLPDSVLGWTGFTDRDVEGVWKWENGDSVTYVNWCTYQPDNYLIGQDYGLLHSNGSHSCWDDAHGAYNPITQTINNFYGVVEMTDCGTTVVRTGGLSSGAFFPIGTTVITYKATDLSGNVTLDSFKVTVKDTSKPVFAAVHDTTVNGDVNRCGAVVNYAIPTAVDLCSSCSVDSIEKAGFVKSGEFGGHTYFRTPVRGTWAEADSMARSIGGYLMAVNDSAENAFLVSLLPDSVSGWIGLNKETGSFKWSNGDPLTFTYWCTAQPDNWLGGQDYVLIHSGGTSGASGCWDDAHSPLVPSLNFLNQYYGVVELPTCGARVARVSGPQSGTVFPVGTTVVTYKAFDGSGNESTTSFKVTVKDKMPPVAVCKNVTVELINGVGTLTADSVNNGSFDLCTGIASKSVSKTTFVASDLPAVVTLTVVDSNGNTATCTATVTAKTPSSLFPGTSTSVTSNGSIVADVKVYPNPTSNTFFVEVPKSDNVSTITLMDVQGKVLEVVNLGVNDDHKVRFDLQSRARGMYLIEVSYGVQRFHSKIVHQ